jgi:hypothetical protein
MFRRSVRSLWTPMRLSSRVALLRTLGLLAAVVMPAAAHADLISLVGATTSSGGGELATYNTVTNQVSLIGSTNYVSPTGVITTGVLLSDIAQNTAGSLYAIDAPTSSTSDFYTLNSSTAVLTQKVAESVYLNALAFDAKGTLWAAGINQIYTVDTGTGALTTLSNPIGIAGYTVSGDLAFFGGNLYVTESKNATTPDILVEINTTGTDIGAGTQVGTNLGVIGVKGLATVGDTLYGFSGNSAYTIDPTSGTATLISGVDLGFGSNGEVHGAASAPEAVPEPSSLALVVIGALTGIGCGWRQRRGRIKGRSTGCAASNS